MNSLYFNCKTGLSGDMVVASLLDLGINPEYLSNELKKLPLRGYNISVKKINKNDVAATKFDVTVLEKQENRSLTEILNLIETSSLEDETKKLSSEIFTNLAQAEAEAHNTTKDAVHFHEIGAVDSIVDIVSASILLNKLGITDAYCGTIALGCGETKTLHGTIKVPTPAVKNLLREHDTIETNIQTELTTPTGAAIIKTIAKTTHKTPYSEIRGYGAGTKNLPIPNVLETIRF